MSKLYNFQRSGNCYKARLFTSLLGIDYERIDFDPSTGDHKKPDYLAINPMGQVPAWVEDDGTTICDSQAVLVFLAKKYGDTNWLPDDAVGQAEVAKWLSFTAFEVFAGIALPRAIRLIGRPGNYEAQREIGLNAMSVLNSQLGQRPYLAAEHITIADIAVFGYVCLAGDAEIDINDYPNVAAWVARIEALENFEPFNT